MNRPTFTVTYTLSVGGVPDEVAALTVAAVLESMPGVHRASVSSSSGTAVVEAEPLVVDPWALAAVLTNVGYTAVPTSS